MRRVIIMKGVQMGKTKEREILHDWHSCEVCAIERGAEWPKGPNCITLSQGPCPYCKKENQTLIPHDDFNWPALKRRAIFD